MENALPGFRAVVYNQPEGVLATEQSGDIACRKQQVPEHLPVVRAGVGDFFDTLSGNNQDMNRRLGLVIPEGEAAIVLVNDVRRNFVFDNFAENRVRHVVFPACLARSISVRHVNIIFQTLPTFSQI